MSGIDEQKILCPACVEKSRFWIGNFESGQCWLLTDKYMKSVEMYNTHVVYENNLRNSMPELDEVKTFRCHCLFKMYGSDTDIYRKILYRMKMFRKKEGITFNSGGTAR